MMLSLVVGSLIPNVVAVPPLSLCRCLSYRSPNNQVLAHVYVLLKLPPHMLSRYTSCLSPRCTVTVFVYCNNV